MRFDKFVIVVLLLVMLVVAMVPVVGAQSRGFLCDTDVTEVVEIQFRKSFLWAGSQRPSNFNEVEGLTIYDTNILGSVLNISSERRPWDIEWFEEQFGVPEHRYFARRGDLTTLLSDGIRQQATYFLEEEETGRFFAYTFDWLGNGDDGNPHGCGFWEILGWEDSPLAYWWGLIDNTPLGEAPQLQIAMRDVSVMHRARIAA